MRWRILGALGWRMEPCICLTGEEEDQLLLVVVESRWGREEQEKLRTRLYILGAAVHMANPAIILKTLITTDK